MTDMKKFLVPSLFLALASSMASASGLYIGGAISNIDYFSGYNASPAAVTGVYSKGTLGTLKTDAAGTITATYLGDESGYDNFFRFFLAPAASNTLYEDSHSPSMPVGSSITTTVQAGDVVPFMYTDSKGKSVTNGVPFVLSDYATFAMLYKPTQLGGKDYANTNAYGMFDFVVGFNDSAKVDADYDDFVVGLKFAPSPVPLPAAAWLFGSALLGFVTLSNRRKV